MWNLKINDINELIYKTEMYSQTQRTTYGYWGEGWGGGIVREFGIDQKKLYITILYTCSIQNIVYQLHINKKRID